MKKKHEYCIFVRGTSGSDKVLAKLFVLDTAGKNYIPVTEGAVSAGKYGRNACEAIGNIVGMHQSLDIFSSYARHPGEECYENLGWRVSTIREAKRGFGLDVDLIRNWDNAKPTT